jgi:hypothetical protein
VGATASNSPVNGIAVIAEANNGGDGTITALEASQGDGEITVLEADSTFAIAKAINGDGEGGTTASDR